MKHTLLALLLFLGFYSNAQNYKGVVMGDTTYYSGGDFEMPFPYQNQKLPNLLRAIWVKDAQLIGIDSVFTFYPSIRRDYTTSNCLDTNGAAWLGKSFTRKPDGTEVYMNLLNEEITLRTQGALNDTWKITTDSSGLEIWGTVSQLSTITIDNTLDSIKEITLQAMQNSMPVPHYHNGKKIILSKEHGFYKTFEFYIFPYYDYWGGALDEYFPLDSSTYNRVDRSITQEDHAKINIQTMYSPGTVWQYVDSVAFSSNPSWYIGVNHVQDSIISKTILSPDTAVVKKSRITVSHGGGPSVSGVPIPSGPVILPFLSTTTTIINDTLAIPWTGTAVIRDSIFPEYTYSQPWGLNGNLYPRYRLQKFNDSVHVLNTFYQWGNGIYFDAVINNCITFTPQLTGYFYKDEGFIPDAYFLNLFRYQTQSLNGSLDFQYRNLYYYKDALSPSNTWGTPLNMIALSNSDISKSNVQIAITPNPSPDGKFKIQWTENIKWEVYNLNGLKLIEGNSLDVNLTNFAQGLYLLKAQTKDKTFYSKLVR